MLQDFAREQGLRNDWHEPGEQGVNVIITGTHLDNAFGNDQSSIPSAQQEYVVHLTVEGEVVLSVNLATLLATATW